MCGISGIIMKDGTAVDQAKLKRMNDAIAHRGPDGEGFYVDGSVGLGNRRLAILELSDQGAMPMRFGDYTITYNGEVYNYIEIRETLLGKGYSFKGGSDTEVILAAYQEWGEACVHRFNGMWGLAIHDKREEKVFISRDRFGVKPVYYHENSSAFLFGSEIKQLLTHIQDRRVNKQILFDYLYLGYHHHTSKTFFEGIFSLDPGHNLVFDLKRGEYTLTKWYELNVNERYSNLTFEEAEKQFENTLDSAIQLRLRSDVKVGTCLSGGLDSSYIATVASKNYKTTDGSRFTAITAKSIDKENDESAYAEMVVKSANLNWKVAHPQVEDFSKVVEDVIETQEEPFGGPSIIMQYFVMEKAKQEGCIVLLDGQGGDEALLGYDRYYAAYLNQQKGVLSTLRSYFSITKNSRLSIRELFLYNLYFNRAGIRAIRQLRRNRFIKPEFKPYLNMALLEEVAEAGKSITNLQKLEITKVQLQKLLKYEDRNSMRFSIEARVPFVDYRVMELALSLPFAFKVREGWSKYILRKCADGKLPNEIAWRQNKIGFEAPKRWYLDRNSLFKAIEESPFLNQIIDRSKLSLTIDDVSLWKLYNVAVWSRKFNVQF